MYESQNQFLFPILQIKDGSTRSGITSTSKLDSWKIKIRKYIMRLRDRIWTFYVVSNVKKNVRML